MIVEESYKKKVSDIELSIVLSLIECMRPKYIACRESEVIQPTEFELRRHNFYKRLCDYSESLEKEKQE